MQNALYDTDLTDEQWKVLGPLLSKPSMTGRPRTCLRRVVNAVLYVFKTGCQWANLPKDFPPKSTVHGHFRAWTRDHVIESIHFRLRAFARAGDGRGCRSAGLAEQAGYDGAKKTKGRKRLLLVDTLGHVLGIAVLPADVPERSGAKALLDEVLASPTWLQRLYVDGGFSGPDFAGYVAELKPGLEVEVVKRSDASPGFKVVPRRWVLERTYGWLRQCRRLARDYERLAESVAAWIYVATIRIMLRRMTWSRGFHEFSYGLSVVEPSGLAPPD